MSSKVRTLIVDDSVVYRTQIKAALEEMMWIEVVGVASNGRLALEKIRQLPVDLLILDLEMPEMSGLETLAAMQNFNMKPKVIVFSSASKRGAETTMEALKLGAADFVAKPSEANSSETPSQRIKHALEPKISALFADKNKSKAIFTSSDSQKYPNIIWDLFKPQVLVIGSSTGGPTALEKIFSLLKVPLDIPILITQHMPPIFTTTFAERLMKISGMPAAEAKDGEELVAGRIYLAPGDYHLSIAKVGQQIKTVLDQGPQVNSVRPAVDPLFTTAAQIYGKHCLGIVLTGMGADGKVGSQDIKTHGGAVIIQDESSCVVFGMPGAVKSVGAFDKMCSLEDIVTLIEEKCSLQASTLRVAAGGH